MLNLQVLLHYFKELIEYHRIPQFYRINITEILPILLFETLNPCLNM